MAADVWILNDTVATGETFPLEVGHCVDTEISLRGLGRDPDGKSARSLLPCGGESDPVFRGIHGPAYRHLQTEHGVAGHISRNCHVHLLLERLIRQRGDEN